MNDIIEDVCPNCNSEKVHESIQTCTIWYGVAPLNVGVIVQQPVMHCEECEEEWTDYRGEDARAAAINLYKRVFNAEAHTEIAGLQTENEVLKQRVKSLEAFKYSVDVALNSGDGTYRP